MWLFDPICQRWLGVAGRQALIPLLMLSTSGCATHSRSRTAIETARRAVVGMTQAEAIRRMGSAGFACGGAPDGVDCARSSGRGIFATCVQHIRFRADPVSGRVDRIDTPEPACFGGFG